MLCFHSLSELKELKNHSKTCHEDIVCCNQYHDKARNVSKNGKSQKLFVYIYWGAMSPCVRFKLSTTESHSPLLCSQSHMANIWWSKWNHELDNFYLDVTFWLLLSLQLEHFLPAALCCFVSNAGKMPQIYEKLWRGLALTTSAFQSVQPESIALLLNVNRHNGNFTKQDHLYVTSKTSTKSSP